MSTEDPLHGAVAVITGAADGIGLALAREAAARGMRVALLDIREDAVRAAAAEIGDAAIGLACDVSDLASLEAARDTVAERLGPVNLIWANAGLGIGQGFLSARRSNLDWMYRVNVDGVIDTVRTFHPQLATDGLRHIGLTGSMAGLTPSAGATPAYDASKYAVVGIAEGLRAELDGTGIGVTLLCPGLVDTRIWDGARARPERYGGARHQDEAAGEHWRTHGMDAAFVARAALDGVAEGRFEVVVPEARVRADAIRARADALVGAVRAPDD
jgi:short-subunit dehydrogenase